MVAPNVTVSELDFSTRVPAFPGVYGAICIEAKKGPVNDWRLVTSETQLLEQYAVNETVGDGDDKAFFSALAFLEGSNKLWVNRVKPITDVGRPHYPAFFVKKSTVASPDDTTGATTFGISSNSKDVDAYNDIQDINFTRHQNDGTFIPVGDPGNTTPADQPVFLIAAKNPGSWGSKIKISIDHDTSEPNGALLPDGTQSPDHKAFNIKVFYNNKEVESFVCSRKQVKDGYGRSLYIENVLAASKYITAADNMNQGDNERPQANTDSGAHQYYELSSGDNGGKTMDGDRKREIIKLTNTNNYQVTLLLDGGDATVPYHQELYKVAEARNDCVAILSVPFDHEKDTDYLNEITKYRNTTLNANTSYAALYSPHLYIYDKFNDRRLYVAPDGYIGAIISRTADRREIWYPPAGFNRGVIGTVLDVRRRYSRGEMDRLYDNQINPIRFAPGRGIVCWGQKTLTSRPSSLDRLNVRLLLIVIEPAIAEALEYFIMEFNDVSTRLQVTSLIESYMENIRSRNGVYDFQVTCSEENNSPVDIDNNRMNVWLFVKPTKSVEYIRFNVIITPTGADFSTVADAI